MVLKQGHPRPFHPFDNGQNRIVNIWELPLVVMDCALVGTKDQIVENAKRIAEQCFIYNIPFTMLWHTNRLDQNEFPEHRAAYITLLQEFRDANCKGLSGGERSSIII